MAPLRCLALLATLCAAGCQDEAPPALNTSAREGTAHAWGNGKLHTDPVRWRLVAVDESGSVVRGSYSIMWRNDGDHAVVANYRLHFDDVDRFELDRHPATGNLSVRIGAGDSMPRTGTFRLRNIDSVDLANQIAYMEIWASFATP